MRFFLGLVMLLCACTHSTSYQQISQQEAKAIMASKKNYVILDVRTPTEYATGHIPGAFNIPNEEIGEEPLTALPDLHQLILIYCRSGNRSKQAAEKMSRAGYDHIMEFGGINTWEGDLVKGSRRYAS